MSQRRATGRPTRTRWRAANRELLGYRHVFETWWIAIPMDFEETWVADGNYWHAWDEHRSVSLSSTVITDDRTHRAVPASEMFERFAGAVEGEPIVETPPGLQARAAVIATDKEARAGHALRGFVVVDGRVLIATITSEDIEWATTIWTSIGYRASQHSRSEAGQSHRFAPRLV